MSSRPVFSASRAISRRAFVATVAASAGVFFGQPFPAFAHGAPAAAPKSAARPLHKLFLLDEPRRQLLYVDEAAPANNWAIPLEGGPAWSMQLVGGNRVLVALPGKGGYREYDMASKKSVREKFDKARYSGAMSAIRLADGRTVLACEGGGRARSPVRIFLFDKNDTERARWEFPQISALRLVRATPAGTLLFGSNKDHIFEIDLAGRVLREARVPGAAYIFQVSALGGGRLLAACGYSGFLAELDARNKVVRKLGGRPEPAGLKFIFMSQFQRLANGNTVVATWTGHRGPDSAKGQQLVEFDPRGEVVWKWHDANLAGSILGVIVADGIDPSRFHPAY
ncbi:MAG: hypothetical protein LBG65_08410 [Puniceicoccales bacterium]|jgi:hypothetical protein|nr:hypothetical protein [Puniceicoccales bacterium]